MHIAIIDRDSGFVTTLTNRIRGHGFDPPRVFTRPVRVDEIALMHINGLIIDPVILGTHAWPWLQQLCERLPELVAVVCTGQSSVSQRVQGLRLGLDDWIAKPCHPEEVIVRVERRRRRADPRADAVPIKAGQLEIRPDQFQVFVDDRSVGLTPREYQLIELLAKSDGVVLERESMYSRLWGYSMVRGDRSVDVFVRKVRHKLEKASPAWRYIHTHFGVGYRFGPEPLDAMAMVVSQQPSQPQAAQTLQQPRASGAVAPIAL
jgi:DNA-binding response OmpR family regulator